MAHGLRIEPLDVLFFRDGRPFDAATRVASGLPLPQTLAGAIRTTLLARTGFDFQAFAKARRDCRQVGQPAQDALKQALRNDGKANENIILARFIGPWLALFPHDQKPVPLFAQPLDLLQAKGSTRFVPLTPRQEPLPGWHDPDGLLPLLREEETNTKASAKLFSLPALREYLKGEHAIKADELFDPGEIYGFENRTGIRVDAERLASADGMIYGIRFLALKPSIDQKHGKYARAGIGLYAEIDCGFSRHELSDLFRDPVPLGGESRYARVTVIESVDWPKTPTSPKTKWLLVSPGFLPFSAQSQRPLPALNGVKAAVSAAGIAVSGWDVAKRGPRPTRFAIPAGAVYYFEGSGPTDGFLGGSDDEKAEGWGFALPGIWEKDNV